MMRLLAALFFVAPAFAGAQQAAPVERLRELEDEHSRVAHWLRALDDERGDVLAILDALDKEARAVRDVAAKADEAMAKIAGRLELALAEEARLQTERERVAAELGPRLTLRYRLRGATSLGALVSEASIGDFLWRKRMVDRMLARDLELVEALARLANEREAARERIESERDALALATEKARIQSAAAESRRREQQAVLAQLGVKHRSYERMRQGLEQARESLLLEISELPPPPEGLGGFGAKRGKLAWPSAGEVELGFGLQTEPRFGTQVNHKGLDLRAPAGTPVWAPHPASVGFAGWFRGYGNLVLLDHGEGYYTLYAHLDSIAVERGARVDEGDMLGQVGDSASLKGAFLYFEVRSGAKALDPGDWLAPR